MLTTILFFGLAASLGFNLWQSMRADQREGYIKRIEKENRELTLRRVK